MGLIELIGCVINATIEKCQSRRCRVPTGRQVNMQAGRLRTTNERTFATGSQFEQIAGDFVRELCYGGD
jgi:hypothetical protein